MADFDQERMNVGAGWQGILAGLHQALTELLGDYQLLQIKQKFGGLRYYIGYPGDSTLEQQVKARELIELAEEDSHTLCEICGKPGSCAPVSSYWLSTLCDLHRTEEEERITALWKESDV